MAEKGRMKEKLAAHLRRCGLIYIAGVVALVFLNNLIFTMTRPRVPENETVRVMVVNQFADFTAREKEWLADVKTAVSEAVTNAIVHGYRNGNGIVRVQARYDDGNLLTVEIGDRGCGIANIWQARQPFYTTADGEERSGMGFTVMESFMDGVDVESKPGYGTNVRMRKQLSRREDVFARRA